MRIANLAGIFTGRGLRSIDGRRPTIADLDFVAGPLHIDIDRSTGLVVRISIGKKQSVIDEDFDADGLIATPGFIDCHTHSIFAGSRANEHFQRWSGASYQEIATKGGGIKRTWSQTATATDEELIRLLNQRLDSMLARGVTCVEIKSGYGGSPESELRLLRLVKRVKDTRFAPRMVPTFMGLHACPPGIDPQAFASSIEALLPIIKKEGLAECVDMFVERGFFSLDACLRFAEAALEYRFLLKAHVDQLSCSNSTEAFARLGATSVEHLEYVSDDGIKALGESATIAVMIPCSSFFLGQQPCPARTLIEGGVKIAIATDFNPGTAPSADLSFSTLLAAANLKLSAAEILCATTFNAASAIGKADCLGCLDTNTAADILLWESETPFDAQTFLQKLYVEQLTPKWIFVQGRRVGSLVIEPVQSLVVDKAPSIEAQSSSFDA